MTNPAALEIPDSTISATSTSVKIPESGPAAPYPSSIAVSERPGVISHVTVWLEDLSHGHLGDLDVMLVGPDGQRVVLMSDAVGSGGAERDIGFADDAAAPLPFIGVPGSNSIWQPTDYGAGDDFPAPAPLADGATTSLSGLDGTSPNGTWKLFVVDDSAGDSGSIYRWRLELETTHVADDYPAVIEVSGLTGAVEDVDVQLNGLTHPTPGNLDVLLVGPAGQRAMIMSDKGSLTDSEGVDLWLDDEADADIGTVVSPGTYRPADDDVDDPVPISFDRMPQVGDTTADGSALSVFDGTDPDGTWKLFVVDDKAGETGALGGGWTLRLTTSGTARTSDGGGVGSPPGSPPTSPTISGDSAGPTVRQVEPGTGTHPGIRSTVLARLSEPVRRRTVTGSTAYLVRAGGGRHVEATVTYREATRTIVIDPRRPLRHGRTYRAVVTTAVRDPAGNRLDQRPAVDGLQRKAWRFTTR